MAAGVLPGRRPERPGGWKRRRIMLRCEATAEESAQSPLRVAHLLLLRGGGAETIGDQRTGSKASPLPRRARSRPARAPGAGAGEAHPRLAAASPKRPPAAAPRGTHRPRPE